MGKRFLILFLLSCSSRIFGFVFGGWGGLSIVPKSEFASSVDNGLNQKGSILFPAFGLHGVREISDFRIGIGGAYTVAYAQTATNAGFSTSERLSYLHAHATIGRRFLANFYADVVAGVALAFLKLDVDYGSTGSLSTTSRAVAPVLGSVLGYAYPISENVSLFANLMFLYILQKVDQDLSGTGSKTYNASNFNFIPNLGIAYRF